MSKVEVAKREITVPSEYFVKQKPGCSSFEQITKVQPLVSQFTATTVPYKVVVELPNVNFRLNEVYILANVTVTFSSNSGTDTYATVQPAVCKWGTSLINQVRLLAGD